MMRLKRYLKNSANPALALLSLLIPFFLLGCSAPIEPTYKEKDIPATIKKICLEDYNLKVVTKTMGKTLWVYAPVSRIIAKDYAITQDKFFDEEMSEQVRNIMTSIGRVLISADRAPEFYCLVISDIEEKGLDYIIIADILDVKKSYANFIPWTEMNKRYIVKLEEAPEAIGDTLGLHIRPYDITRREFIADQIAQRLESRFRAEDLSKLYEVKSVKVQFTPTTLIIDADIKPNEMRLILSENKYLTRESLQAIAETGRAYDFWGFQDVRINDIAENKSTTFSRAVLEAIK